jgi:hypothetical protein
MRRVLDRYCSACRGWHQVEVIRRDNDGFPAEVRPVAECVLALRDSLGKAAGRVLSIQVDVGDWHAVEATAELALEVNDPTLPGARR